VARQIDQQVDAVGADLLGQALVRQPVGRPPVVGRLPEALGELVLSTATAL